MPTKVSSPDSVKRWVVKSYRPDEVEEQEGRIDSYGHFWQRGYFAGPDWASVRPNRHFATKAEAMTCAKQLRDAEVKVAQARIKQLQAVSYDTCDND